MAEEEKPATLPEKECGAAKVSDQPKGLSEGQVESSAVAQVVPADSAPAGAPQEKSVKEVTVTEVSPEVKTPSSAGEGVSFLGFACVCCKWSLQQLINLMPFQCYSIAGSSHDTKTSVWDLKSRVWLVQVLCGSLVFHCCSWFLVLLCHDTIRFAARLMMLCELFFRPAPPHLKCLPVTLLIHVYFYFYFGGQQFICFSFKS